MQLTVRHLAGSRAGQHQTFDTSEVSIGRHPSSMILFDPEKDRVVSGKHATMVYQNNSWILRDLGSSNGTFVGGEQVRERVLRPGEIITFGKNGPQVQVQFESDEVAATMVVPMDDVPSQQAPREGKTVIMMMPGAGGAPAPTAPAPAGAAYAGVAPKRKGGIGKALAIVAAALLVLIVGAAALAFAVRSANMKKKKSTAVQTATTTSTTAVTSTAAAAAQADAERINQQIAAQQHAIAQTQATLQQKTQTPGGATNQEAEDLKRQLAESQAMLEQMTRELQQKNDQINSGQSKPPKTEVRYIPVPATTTPAKKTAPPPATTVPVATTTPSKTQPATTSTTTPAPVVAQAAPLFTGKRLKKKVLITPLPSEIPPANLPSGTPRDLANLLTSALVSTGDYVVGPKGQASVSVMVTNYRADVKKGLDTKKTADSARKLGKIFGQNVPGNPVDVRSVAYDASMSVRVKLYDTNGRVLAEVEPSAASQDRKTKTALGGVSFHDVALSDTAAGDVARKVIGDAIDTVRNGLSNLEWNTTVQGSSKDKVTLASGRNANLEPGDVFDIIDGGKPVMRVRITSVTETTSDAELMSPPTKLKLNGKMARYMGSENQVNTTKRERSLVVRIKTPAYDGPGDSFNTIRELRVGQKLSFQYSVGAWARASDGGSSFWVPLSKVQVST